MVLYYSVSDGSGSHFMPGLNSSVFIKKWGKNVTFRGTKRGKKEFRLDAVCYVPYWQLVEVKMLGKNREVHLKNVHRTRELC